MQSLSNPHPAAATQPLTVIDAATLTRVAGGFGPHGNWSAPEQSTTSRTSLDSFGPHGNWRDGLFGPHGNW